jgi:RNA polymerase sigma-70 factor (ECF subfamily)
MEEPVSIGEQWTRVVAGVRNDDPEGTAELYRNLIGFKSYFARHLGLEDADDLYHDLIMAIIASIRNGTLREPARLAGYAKAVARNAVSDRIRALKRRQLESNTRGQTEPDKAPNPEANAIRREAKAIARCVLDGMPPRHRAVLVRFYIEEEKAGTICADLNLTATQFRLIKSRAKARFGELMRLRIGQQSVRGSDLQRKSA